MHCWAWQLLTIDHKANRPIHKPDSLKDTAMTEITAKLTHHELSAEWVTDSQGRAIMLTQTDGSGCNEPSTILIDPWQLRAVCEQFGIIASDRQAAKTITMMTRRLLVLRDRIDELANYLCNHSDHKHADLSYEMTYANATADIAAEFVADLVNACQPSTQPKVAQVPEIPAPELAGTQPALI